MNDWRTTPPSAAAAEQICAWLDARIDEIQRDEIARAREALEDPGWRIRIDIGGVPLSELARIDGLVESACDSLADRALEPAAAIQALREAVAVVTPDGAA